MARFTNESVHSAVTNQLALTNDSLATTREEQIDFVVTAVVYGGLIEAVLSVFESRGGPLTSSNSIFLRHEVSFFDPLPSLPTLHNTSTNVRGLEIT